MPAINFKKCFSILVETGKKCQTIRPLRKQPIKVGDTLYLYTGLRTKQCKKLGEAICSEIHSIKISNMGIILDGVYIDHEDAYSLATLDGFLGYRRVIDFVDFFSKQYGLPFSGVVIRW